MTGKVMWCIGLWECKILFFIPCAGLQFLLALELAYPDSLDRESLGLSRFVDGVAIGEWMRRERPGDFHLLSSTPVTFAIQVKEVSSAFAAIWVFFLSSFFIFFSFYCACVCSIILLTGVCFDFCTSFFFCSELMTLNAQLQLHILFFYIHVTRWCYFFDLSLSLSLFLSSTFVSACLLANI